MNPKQLLHWGLALFVCLAAYSAPVDPNDTESAMLAEALQRPLTLQETQELELVARLQTTIAVLYREAVKDGEAIEARTGQVPGEGHWKELLRHIGKRIVDDFRPIAPPTKLQIFKGWLGHLSFSRISKTIYNIARTQGIPAAGAVAAGAIMDFGAPALCAFIGHPELGPLTWLIPFEIPGYTLGYLIQQRLMKTALIRNYGGKENYQKFYQPYHDNLEAMHLDGIEDLLVPLTNKVREMNGAVIADESGFLESWKARLGLSTPRMNWDNMVKFCRRRNIAESIVKALEANKEVPEQFKAVLLLHYLDEAGDPRVLADLGTTFSKSFVEATSRPELAPLTPWIRQFAHARTLADVHRILREVPAGAPASLVARLWQDSILPIVLQNNESITFLQSLKLRSGFYPLLARATSHPNEEWDASYTEAFVEYTRKLFPNDRFPGEELPPVAKLPVTKTAPCSSAWAAMAVRK